MAAGGIEEDYDAFDHGDDMEDSPLLFMPTRSVRDELVENKVRRFYNSLGQEPPDFIDPNDFELDKDDHLYLKTDEGKVQLTTKPDPSKFLAKSTLKQRLSVIDQSRLNIGNLRKEAVSKLQNIQQELPTEGQILTVPLAELSQTADEIIEEIERETSLTDPEETALKTLHDPPLPMREILALNESLRTIRGELTNNLAKLSELDEHINREKQKLVEADDANLEQEIKDRILQRLRDLELERAARLEVASTNREQLRTQVNRIRETIQRILYENTTLAERIQTLFREQGITIASILTAIGFAISTLVYALTGSSTPQPPQPPTPPTPPSPPQPPGKSWIKKQLDHLKNLLQKLAAKALDVLPGILGSVVSWILSTASKVVGFMADHLWTLGVLVTGFLLSQIKET